jgi:hypothetical protein
MNEAELQQAGFSPQEISSYSERRNLILKSSGFSDAEIEAKYGPGVTSPENPKAADIDKFFNVGMEGVKFDPVDGVPQTHFADMVSPWVRPWEAAGYSAAEALNRGMAGFATHLNTLSEYVGKKIGIEPGGIFKKSATQYNQNVDYWKKRADEVGTSFFQELVSEAVGGAVPGIAEFLLNVPYAAMLGAAEAEKSGENEIAGALLKGAKRGILGAVLHAMTPLNQYLRAPSMGAVFGTQAALEGADTKEVAKAFGTGAIYSMMSPGGRYGLNEMADNARSYLGKEAAKLETAKAEVMQEGAVAAPGVAVPEQKPLASTSPTPKPEIVQPGATPGGKQPWEMTRDEYEAELTKYEKLADNQEMQDGEGVPASQDAIDAYNRGDWETFSRARGYSEEAISNFRRWVQLASGDNFNYNDVTPENIHRQHVQQALSEGKPVPPDVLKEYGLGGKAKEPWEMKPQGDFRRTPGGPVETGKPIGRSEIKQLLEEKLAIPIRTGRFQQQGLGIFKPKEEVIRTKYANDIETISHEIGHGLHKFLWPESVKKGATAIQFAPYAEELIPIATKTRSGQAPETEGFAEFIRLYVTDAKKAQAVAPKFYDYFDSLLQEKSPEVRNILLEARKRYDLYMKQPSLQRVLSQISVNEKQESTGSAFDKIYTASVDDLYPLDLVVREMSQGEKLPISKDPYKLARLMKGWVGKSEAFLKNKPFDFGTYKDIPGSKSLKEIIDPIRDNLDEFRAYVVSKRTLELSGRNIETGILKEDAQKVVDEYDGKFNQAFEDLKKFQDHTLNYLKQSGLIDQKSYDKMKSLNADYVPFYRVMEDQKGYGTGSGLQSRNPIKGIKGSWRDIVDPLESIIKNTFTYINMAEKNAVGTALVDLSKTKEGLGKFVEKIPTPVQKITIKEAELMSILQTYGKWTETSRFKQSEKTLGEKISGVAARGEEKALSKIEERAREALSARGFKSGEVDQIINRLKGAKTPEDRQKVIERTIEKITVIETVKEFGFEVPEGMIELFRKSPFMPSDNVIQVWKNGEASLYQVHPDIARTFQALDAESTNMILRILAKPASWLRAGATLTPEFIARNPLRDQWTAFIYSKYGFIPGFDTGKGIFAMAKKTDLYWDWKKGGGDHSMLVSMDRDYLQDNLGDLLQKYPVTNLIKNPIKALRLLSELGEAGTRLGEMAAAQRKLGTSKEGIQEAAFSSREITLDFNRCGAKTKAVNAIIAFWNAQIQGGDKMLRAFKDNPVGSAVRVAASITLPSVLLAIANHDDPRLKEVPQWQKDLFWIIPTDSGIWRIPKPFELGILFGSIPERITHFIMSRDPKAFDEVTDSFMRGFSPSMVPTIAVPIIENWANKSFFFDHSIVARSREELLPQYQYGEYTTETAKAMGRLIGYFPGIGDTSAASPAYIENLVRGWTGGLGKYALDILDLGMRSTGITEKGYQEPSKTMADIPFIKAFAVRFPSSNTASVEKFYDNFQKAKSVEKTVRVLMEKEQRPQDAIKLWQEMGGADLDGIQKALNSMRNVVDLIYKDPGMKPEEKRQLIDTVYLQMIQIAQMGNQTFDSFIRSKQ